MGLQSISGLIAGQISNNQRLFGLLAAQLAANDRLATRPGFDPGAFVASERLRSQLASLDAGSRSIQLGRAISSLADSSLESTSTQLDNIRTLVLQASVASGDDRLAIQGAIQTSVNQLESQLSSPFFGRLGGSGSAIGVTSDPSGTITNAVLTQVPSQVPEAGFDIDIEVVAAGTSAEATIANAAGIAVGGRFELIGATGRVAVTANGSAQDVVDQINAGTGRSGLAASLSGADVVVSSVDAGSRQSIGIANLGAAGLTVASNVAGTDAQVRVNGVAASARGNVVSFGAGGFAGSFAVDPNAAGGTTVQLRAVSGGITVATDGNGGSLTFGVPAFAGSLGSSSGVGSLASLGANAGGVSLSDSLAIIDAAQSEVLASRAQLGSIDNRLAEASSAIENQISGISSAFADLRSVDVAGAILDLTRTRVQAELQMLLLRENNVTQASILRLLTSGRSEG